MDENIKEKQIIISNITHIIIHNKVKIIGYI